MKKNNDLIVPMLIEALIVNKEVKRTGGFTRQTMDYKNRLFRQFDSPDPKVFDNKPTLPADGIILQWTLPQALRNGIEKNNKVEYELVPNRWLVQRTCPANADYDKLYLISSDKQIKGAATRFLDPNKSELKPISIGTKKELNKGWDQTDIYNEEKMYLTVIGPSNPNFASYQSFNENVLSFYDTEIAPPPEIGVELNYRIIGWYGNHQADLFEKCSNIQAIKKRLEVLNWSTTSKEEPIRYVFLDGQLNKVTWNDKEPKQSSQKPTDLNKVEIAIGTTTQDASGALPQNLSSNAKETIKAFDYGLLSFMDNYHLGSEQKIKNKIKETWFTPNNSGYYWALKTEKDLGTVADAVKHGIEKLNTLQKKLDDLFLKITTDQRELYRVWWKIKRGEYNEGDKKPYEHLEKYLSGRRTALISSLQKNQLQASSQQALIAEELRIVQLNKVDKKQIELRKVPLASYMKDNDPVILLKNIGAESLIDINEPLKCSLLPVNKTHPIFQSYKENPIPSAAYHLLKQTVEEVANPSKPTDTLLKSVNALINDGKTWENQPWSPLFLDWEIDFYPIDLPSGIPQNTYWDFQGKEYVLKSNGKHNPTEGGKFSITQRMYLTESAKELRIGMLQNYQRLIRSKSAEVERELAEAQKMDSLSQTFDGIQQSLASLNTQSNQIPIESSADPIDRVIATLFNFELDPKLSTSYQSLPNLSYYTPILAKNKNPFNFIKAGLFELTKLRVVDKFGQRLDLIYDHETQANQSTKVSDNLKSNPNSILDHKYTVQLNPRINQTSRLQFDLVEQQNQVPNLAGISAWLVHNLLNESLVFYSNIGDFLGELRILNGKLDWSNHPGGKFPDWRNLETGFPLLFQFIQGLYGQSVPITAFEDLLKTIDKALEEIETIDQPAHLPFQILGRPLALVDTKLALQLQYSPNKVQSWAGTDKKPNPVYKEYQFPIKIGEKNNSQDGLIGYFKSNNQDINFKQFYTEAIDADTAYVQKIEPGNFPILHLEKETPMALLIDPEAAIHAYSGILPVQTLQLDYAGLEGILQKMQFYFKIDATLSKYFTEEEETKTVEGTKTERFITIPQPPAVFGNWSWIEPKKKEEGKKEKKSEGEINWEELQIVDIDNLPHLADEGNNIHSGFLKLIKPQANKK